MEKKTETTIVYWGYIGCRGYIGIMDKKMETTISSILGLYREDGNIMEATILLKHNFSAIQGPPNASPL